MGGGTFHYRQTSYFQYFVKRLALIENIGYKGLAPF